MTVTFELAHCDSQVVAAAGAVFSTMLGMELCAQPAAPAPAAPVLTAAVYFAGAWSGALLLECARGQAAELASRLMAGLGVEGADADLRDALGELANMVAGSFKSLLGPGVHLSIPSVVDGTDYSLRLCGRNASHRVRFDTGLGTLDILIIQLRERLAT
jgi:chemotaxis protein CheX